MFGKLLCFIGMHRWIYYRPGVKKMEGGKWVDSDATGKECMRCGCGEIKGQL